MDEDECVRGWWEPTPPYVDQSDVRDVEVAKLRDVGARKDTEISGLRQRIVELRRTADQQNRIIAELEKRAKAASALPQENAELRKRLEIIDDLVTGRVELLETK